MSSLVPDRLREALERAHDKFGHFLTRLVPRKNDERSFGSFTRRLRLPVEIKADKVEASFRDGVLEIKMPKSEAAKQNAKKIAVS